MSFELERESLIMAINSVKERKSRSVLTVLGIVIGIAAIVSLVSIGEGTKATVEDAFSSFGANKIIVTSGFGMSGFGAPTVSDKLTNKDVDNIERIRGVELAIPVSMQSIPVEYKGNSMPVVVIGVDMDVSEDFFSDVQGYELGAGRFPKKGDKYSCVVGYSVANDIYPDEVRIRDKLSIKGVDVRVVGILKQQGNSQDDAAVIMPLEGFKEVAGTEDIGYILVKIADSSMMETTGNIIQEYLDKEHGEDAFTAMSTVQLAEQIGGILNMLSLLLGAIAAISLLVAGIGIANTMFMTVIERTKEIGIMKSIGATQKNILEIFLIEAAIIGLIGGVLGCGLGIVLSGVISQASVYLGISIQTAVTPTLLAVGMSFAVVVGVVSGFIPARKAAKMNPIEALRYE